MKSGTRVWAFAFFLLVTALLSCAPSSVPSTGASRYPTVTIYVGSG